MFRDGLSESSRFSSCHPAVNIIFYTLAIGITMFSLDPVFLCVTTVFAWAYSILLKGRKAIKTNLLFMLPIVLIMTVVNGLFTHNGKTVLFFLNDSRITLEALAYGMAAALLLGAVVVWFASFNVVMSSDKLIYLFGKAAPVLGLTLSMIFRFIPLLKNRFKEIKSVKSTVLFSFQSAFSVTRMVFGFNRYRRISMESKILVISSPFASPLMGDSVGVVGSVGLVEPP